MACDLGVVVKYDEVDVPDVSGLPVDVRDGSFARSMATVVSQCRERNEAAAQVAQLGRRPVHSPSSS